MIMVMDSQPQLKGGDREPWGACAWCDRNLALTGHGDQVMLLSSDSKKHWKAGLKNMKTHNYSMLA